MRVTVSKSKNSESFYVTHSYVNKNGKSTSKIYKKLGTLKELREKLGIQDRDQIYAWCKEQCAIETKKYKEETETVNVSLSPTALIKKDEQRLFNCGYLFLQKLCAQVRMDNIFRNIDARHKYDYDLEAVFTDLIYARILNPSSKMSSFEYCQTLLEQPKYQLHNVYQALSVLASESDYIQSELYKNTQFVHHRDQSILYYDCTNFFFEISQEDELRKYGKSKENRPNPIVGFGMFMDTDGIPLAFDAYPGNRSETLSLIPLEKKIVREFKCSKFIYCSDSAHGSAKNKQFNDMGDRAYVITQSLKKMKAEDRNAALDPTGFRKLGSNERIDISKLDENDPEVFNTIYYKELNFETQQLPNQSLIVTYSPKYKNYQQNIRQGQIDRANRMIENKDKVKLGRKNPNDPARFINRIDTTKDGEAATETTYSLNQDRIDEEAMYDGFYAVVTDIDDDPAQIIAINRNRWQIEECFRIMKTEFKARPVYLSREERIKAHFLTCFVALIIYRLLEIKLGNKYTCDQIINTLRNMNLTAVDAYGYIPSYERTELTDALHELTGFRTDTQIIKKKKMRSIIRESKEK